MKRFVEGADRNQSILFPEHLDDYVAEENIVRIVEAFIEALDLKILGFAGAEPADLSGILCAGVAVRS